MPSTRARKEKFIKSFGDLAVLSAVTTMFNRYGLDMLSDEQIEELTSDMADDAMSATKRNIRNRAIYRRALDGASA